MREALSAHDLVIVLGAGVMRLYMYEPGAFIEPGTRVVVAGTDTDQLHRSAATLAVLAPTGPARRRGRRRSSTSGRSIPTRRRFTTLRPPPRPPHPASR